MPRINDNSCCGFKTVTGLDISANRLDKWLSTTFKNRDSYYTEYSWKTNVGKMYQCIFGNYQWSKEHHRVMKKHGWKMVAKWDNSSGSICRAYQFVTPLASRVKER